MHLFIYFLFIYFFMMLDSVAWVPPENSWGDKEEIHPFPFSLVSHVKDSIFAPPFALNVY